MMDNNKQSAIYPGIIHTHPHSSLSSQSQNWVQYGDAAVATRFKALRLTELAYTDIVMT